MMPERKDTKSAGALAGPRFHPATRRMAKAGMLVAAALAVYLAFQFWAGWTPMAAALATILSISALAGFANPLFLRSGDGAVRPSAEMKRRVAVLEAAAAATSDGIIVARDDSPGDRIDPDALRIVEVNDRIQAVFGYEPDELVGQHPRMLNGRMTDRQTLAWMRAELEAGRSARHELRQRHKAGHAIWIEKQILPIHDPETGQRFVLSVQRDITARKQMEAALIEARDAAEAANRAKSAFLGHMSHDLRTPLNAICGFAEMLATGAPGPLTPSQKNYIRHIQRGGKDLAGLIDTLFDLGQLAAGEIVLDPQPLVLNGALRDIVAHLRRRHPQARVDIAAPPALVIDWDHARFDQVLQELIEGAIARSGDFGPVRVSHRMDRRGDLFISVSDPGEPIPTAWRPYLFTLFSDGQDARQTRPPGIGIGLELAAAVVRAHGGAIWLAETAHEGNEICLSIPADRVLRDGALTLAGMARHRVA